MKTPQPMTPLSPWYRGLPAAHFTMQPKVLPPCQWPVLTALANAYAVAEDEMWVGAMRCSRAAGAQCREARWWTDALLQGYQHSSNNLSLNKGHICLATHPPWCPMIPPYQCWWQALTHLYFVSLFRNYQISDFVWEMITKQAFSNQPLLLPNMQF